MNIIFFGDSLVEGVPGESSLNILKEKLPEHSLINLGKGGDTVISLLRRIRKMEIKKRYDIAFIWVGVNDILVRVSLKYLPIKEFLHQPWVKDIGEFTEYYFELLNLVSANANKTFTVSPLVIGEDANNEWNKQLGEISAEIEKLSTKFKNVDYIDLRKDFISILATKESSSYIINSVFWDSIVAWLFNTPDYIEEKSHERDLYLTLDGVHLNRAGAQIVADRFLRCIQNEIQGSS